MIKVWSSQKKNPPPTSFGYLTGYFKHFFLERARQLHLPLPGIIMTETLNLCNTNPYTLAFFSVKIKTTKQMNGTYLGGGWTPGRTLNAIPVIRSIHQNKVTKTNHKQEVALVCVWMRGY